MLGFRIQRFPKWYICYHIYHVLVEKGSEARRRGGKRCGGARGSERKGGERVGRRGEGERGRLSVIN